MDELIAELANWLKAAIKHLRVSGTTSLVVELMGDGLVQSYPIDADESIADDLARELVERANVDARALGTEHYTANIAGIGRYAVPVRIERAARMLPAHGQQMSYGGAPSFNGYGGAAPFQAEHPMVAMFQGLVRHMDAAHQAILASNEYLVQSLKDANASLRSMEKQRSEMITTMEELATKKHERDLVMHREVKNDEWKERAMDTVVMPIVQQVQAYLMGGGPGGIPAGIKPMVDSLTKAFSSDKFDIGKLEMLIQSGMLTEDQGIALVQLFKMIQTMQEAQAKAEAAKAGAVGAVAAAAE